MTGVREEFMEKIGDQEFVDWVCSRGGKFRFPVYQGMEFMDNDIGELELSVRGYNCLKRAGYNTINDFVSKINSREDLKTIRNLGRKSSDEIMIRLFLYTYENLSPERRVKYLARIREMN